MIKLDYSSDGPSGVLQGCSGCIIDVRITLVNWGNVSRVVLTLLMVPNMDINLFDDAPDSVDTIVYILSGITNFLGLLPRCCGL